MVSGCTSRLCKQQIWDVIANLQKGLCHSHLLAQLPKNPRAGTSEIFETRLLRKPRAQPFTASENTALQSTLVALHTMANHIFFWETFLA